MNATADTAAPETTKPTFGTEIASCSWCGIPFTRSVGNRGRPRLFCCDECKDAETRMNQAESLIAQTIGRMDPERARSLRRRLWSAANAVNVAGRERAASTKAVAVRPEWKPALDALVDGASNALAAEAAGVEVATILAWRKAKSFRRYLDNARRRAGMAETA